MKETEREQRVFPSFYEHIFKRFLLLIRWQQAVGLRVLYAIAERLRITDENGNWEVLDLAALDNTLLIINDHVSCRYLLFRYAVAHHRLREEKQEIH